MGEIADRLAKGAVTATVGTGVSTTIHGGNLGDNLAANLRSAAVMSLGAEVAEQIGNAYKGGDINQASRYIAHAALGGAMDVALGGNGVSGAIGGVAGELVSDAFVRTYVDNKLSNPNAFATAEEFQKEVDRLQEVGVDMARLGAGLAAAATGGNIGTAANTGGNAAENNAIFCLAIAATLVGLEVADKALTAYDAWRLAKAINEGDTDSATEIGAELALGLATEAIPGNKIAIVLAKSLDSLGLAALGMKIVGKVGDDAAKLAVKVDTAHLSEMAQLGIKHNPKEVLFTHKMPDGKIVFLEKGWQNADKGAGLKHIVNEHIDEFTSKEISESEIPAFIHKALSNGKIVGYQGKGTGRPIYEVLFNGKKRNVAITVGSNGFVVGANPK